MDVSGKTITRIIEDSSLSKEESQWLEKMLSMIFTLRKHSRLNEVLSKDK